MEVDEEAVGGVFLVCGRTGRVDCVIWGCLSACNRSSTE